MRICVAACSFAVTLALVPAFARAEAPSATREAHPIDGAHVAFGLDAGYLGPFGDLGLRLSVAINAYVSIEVGGGIGFVRAEGGTLIRGRKTYDGTGFMIGVGVTRGGEYGDADGDEFVDVVRGVVELGAYRRIGRKSAIVFRLGLKATPEVVSYSTSYSMDGYYDDIPRVLPFAGISLIAAGGL